MFFGRNLGSCGLGLIITSILIRVNSPKNLLIDVVSKATKYLYRYTFEYQMKNVNKFILDRRTNTLKVELKNNVFETIFRFTNLEKTYSDGIIYLLNEKLNVI